MLYDTQLERLFHACVTGALLGRVTLVTFRFLFLVSYLCGEMYLGGCELHIQTLKLLIVLTLKQYVNSKPCSIRQSP